jgi:hypothetical protein
MQKTINSLLKNVASGLSLSRGAEMYVLYVEHGRLKIGPRSSFTTDC